MLKSYPISKIPISAFDKNNEIDVILVDTSGGVHMDGKLIRHAPSMTKPEGYHSNFNNWVPGIYASLAKSIDNCNRLITLNSRQIYTNNYIAQSYIKKGDLYDRKPEPIEIEKNHFLFLDEVIRWHATYNYHNSLTTLFKLACRNTETAAFLDKIPMYYVQDERKIGFGSTYNNRLVGNPTFVFNNNNGIYDCGFGAYQNIISQGASAIPEGLRALLTLFNIEVALSHAAYIIFSTQASATPSNKDPLNILLGAASKFPLINPNQSDHLGASVIPDRKGARSRKFGIITHYTLLDYYQSDEFKKLKLTI